jgi:hypothetical protein
MTPMTTKKLALWLVVLWVPSCLLQPKPPPGPELAAASQGKRKSLPIERWQQVGSGVVGVAYDKKGSSGTWGLDDGPRGQQKSLLIEYDLKPGGFVGAWHTTERVNLSRADGLKFMAKADPPCTVQLTLTDANRVSYMTVFQVPSKDWTEIKVPLAVLDKNPNYQPPDAVQGKPVDWSRTTSMGFDARTDGQGKFWIGPVYADEAQ